MPIYEYLKGGKTHYYYAFEVPTETGKRKTIKKRGFKGQKEAERAERKARVEWEEGKYVDPSKVKFADYITKWLERKNDISKKTRYTNKGHLKNHIIPQLGHYPLQKITAEHIEEFVYYLKQTGLASGTIRKIFNLVQTAFNDAYQKELIKKNPFDHLSKGSRPKVEKGKIDYWTREEVMTFLDRIGPDHHRRALFVLAIYTGMRKSEMLALKWRDVDYDAKRIYIKNIVSESELQDRVKTSSSYRSITVSDTVLDELLKHKEKQDKQRESTPDKEDNDLIFAQNNGRPYSDGNFHKFWKRTIEKTGMRYIRFHDLRHTCASLLLSANVHPKVVQEMLGHSSIKITLDTYSHLLPNMQGEAASTLENMLNKS